MTMMSATGRFHDHFSQEYWALRAHVVIKLRDEAREKRLPKDLILKIEAAVDALAKVAKACRLELPERPFEDVCESCDGFGFLFTTENKIERCDACSVYSNDDAAIREILFLVEGR